MILFKYLSFKNNSTISKSARIYPFSIVKNSSIDDYSYISYNCTINNVTIGKFCSIAKGVKIGLGFHPTNFLSSSPIFYSPDNPLNISLVKEKTFDDTEPVKIGNDVWIGANVVILDGLVIGDGCVIGANSVVTKDIEPFSIVGGVPARLIKKRFSTQIIESLMKLKWWEFPISFLQRKNVNSIFSKKLTENKLLELEALVKNR